MRLNYPFIGARLDELGLAEATADELLGVRLADLANDPDQRVVSLLMLVRISRLLGAGDSQDPGHRCQDGTVLIQLLGENDHEIFDAAVRMFRNVEVRDHTPFLTDPATIAFVALDDNQVVGWAWGNRQRHASGYSQVQLYEIEVCPDWRGRRLGHALLERFLKLASDEGHKRMWLFTDHGNRTAVALYRSAGGQPAPHDDASFWWRLNDSTEHDRQPDRT